LKERAKFHTQPVTTPLEYPDTTFPYYEGLNRIAGDKYWLGVYWRNNKFTISFLKALCQLCLQTDIGKISLTPWKSFIVKGITEKDRIVWEKLLGKWGINIRHSSLELNWHLPVLDKEALEMKTYLVRALDQQDISTYGLTFTVKTMKSPVLFTSVVVEKNTKDRENVPDTYNIMYSKEFNSNLMEYTYYPRKVPKEIIPALLIELSKKYYDQLEAHKPHAENGIVRKAPASSTAKALYQCENCLTIYDGAYGDEATNISPGTAFDKLPETYTCPVCGSAKSSYHLVQPSEN
jgi:rubredoxin